MKTIYKTKAYDHEWGRTKQVKLEQKTGLKWYFYSTGNGMIFSPVITRETSTDDALAQELKSYLTIGGDGFVALSEKSEMNLADVLIAANTLVRTQQAIPIVNRLGQFAAIRKKK